MFFLGPKMVSKQNLFWNGNLLSFGYPHPPKPPQAPPSSSMWHVWINHEEKLGFESITGEYERIIMSYNCPWSASRSNRSSLHYHAQLEVHPKQGSNFFTQLNSGGTGQCGPQHNATSLSISTGLCVSEPTTHVSEPTTHYSSTHYPLPMLVKPLPTIHVSEPMSLDVIV